MLLCFMQVIAIMVVQCLTSPSPSVTQQDFDPSHATHGRILLIPNVRTIPAPSWENQQEQRKSPFY